MSIVKVQDSKGRGINGVSVKFQGDLLKENFVDGFIVAETETRTNFRGQLDPGRLSFAMFEGDYWVQLVDGNDGISGIVGPLNYDVDRIEQCGTEELEEVIHHYS